MEIKQFYLACLSHASYLVGSGDECAIVDPQRDVQIYLDAARERGMRITHVLETHLHADFVSGHRELAEITGAEIVFSHRAGAKFPHRPVKDGDVVVVGGATLRVLETPGHTPEGISILVHDEGGIPKAVLTGDTLFIGDAGRPDLAAGAGYSPQEMAGMLFDSLRDKLMTLPDAVEVLPAHGAGSLCGRNMSSELTSTIGAQKASNHALQPMTRERFIALMTADLPEQPPYFAMDARLNKEGPASVAARPMPPPLTAAEVAHLQERGATILDVRTSGQYCASHVPRSIGIGLSGQFASWAGTLLSLDKPVVLISDGDDQALEAQLRLSRVGIENIAGRLQGEGVTAWAEAGRALATTPQATVAELGQELGAGSTAQVLDVRRPREHAGGHVPGALNIPLDRLAADAPGLLEQGRPLRVICQSGYRSTAALGLLEGLGFSSPTNILGGTAAWIQAGHEVDREAGSSCSL